MRDRATAASLLQYLDPTVDHPSPACRPHFPGSKRWESPLWQSLSPSGYDLAFRLDRAPLIHAMIQMTVIKRAAPPKDSSSSGIPRAFPAEVIISGGLSLVIEYTSIRIQIKIIYITTIPMRSVHLPNVLAIRFSTWSIVLFPILFNRITWE